MYNLDLSRPAATRAVDAATATAVTVVDPVPCRMRAVVCRSISERAVVEYTGTETDDRQAVLDVILPQIPDDAWQRNTANSWAYIEGLECIDGDERAADAGMRSRSMTRHGRGHIQTRMSAEVEGFIGGILAYLAYEGTTWAIEKLKDWWNKKPEMEEKLREEIDQKQQELQRLNDQLVILQEVSDQVEAELDIDPGIHSARRHGGRSRSQILALTSRSDQPAELPEVARFREMLGQLMADAEAAAASADPEALAAALVEADADLEALREKLAAVPPAADPASDA